MALSNNSSSGTYHRLFVELADPRTNDWFLVRDPWPVLVIVGLYLYFSLSLGPRIMEHRRPFQLQKTLVVYNFLQVLLSCWLFYESLDGAWLRYNWKCQPVDYSTRPEALRIARGVYIYFLSKISELLDTVFFVIRKKNEQITFLHMYHHSIMPIVTWYAVKYLPGGHSTFIGMINTFVHIIMYTYYMFAAMGPRFQRYLFWKRYITTLQMLQFCIVFVHGAQLLFYDCGYPRYMVVLTLPNAIFFYFLFNDFYSKAYEKPVSKNRQQNGHIDDGANDGIITNGFKANNKKHFGYEKKAD